ncbi:MAG: sigma-54 dependent transcriptional regulator, partial [Proteobacteria bacterium]|nr:sigma-54 dependent transcriptional regulator [Pseudomonadota bacterium]
NSFDVTSAYSLGGLRRALEADSFNVVLLDLHLGLEDGIDGLEVILRQSPATTVFMLSAHGSIERAVEAMRKGASGFFDKGAGVDHTIGELAKELQSTNNNNEELPRVNAQRLGLIGRSDSLMEVLDKIERLAQVDSSVLLHGESGTGKEVIAHAIHRTSKRKNHRFTAINCSAIPEALLESELFGHKKGAFTDAKADRKGIFEITSLGTLLLDEIGDMSLGLQAKLLRVLQEREITPVGSSESIKIDTRIIAATHHNLRTDAETQKFREDLYYRLAVIVIKLPALRDRVEDIPLLVEHFLGVFNDRFSRQVRMPSQSDMNQIVRYSWPGNIRELQNAIERAVVMSVDGRVNIADVFVAVNFDRPESLRVPLVQSSNIENFQEIPSISAPLASEKSLFDLMLTQAKSAFEKRYLEFQIKECRGNIQALAEKSGRYRADIYRLMNRHGIEYGK